MRYQHANGSIPRCPSLWKSNIQLQLGMTSVLSRVLLTACRSDRIVLLTLSGWISEFGQYAVFFKSVFDHNLFYKSRQCGNSSHSELIYCNCATLLPVPLDQNEDSSQDRGCNIKGTTVGVCSERAINTNT